MSASRHNNFDFLRLAAALMVVHGHGWVLAGGQGPGLWGVPFDRVGLDVFFSISGYLVTSSWERGPSLAPFLAKRCLRIFPGLAVCVIVTILLVGPLATTRPLGEYFAAGETWRYLTNIALRLQLTLPGTFAASPESGAVNGSLWSLAPEFACYLAVPLVAWLTWRGPVLRCWTLALLAALIGGVGLALFEVPGAPRLGIYGIDLKYAFVEVPFFFGGAVLALLEPRVLGLWRADVCLLFFTLNFAISAWFDWWNVPFEWLSLPYMVICFGRMSLPLVRDAGRFGDLSYGMYLYAFPVQQLVLTLWPGLATPVLACVAITAGVAALSWHLVEKPAMRGLRRTRAATLVAG